MKFIVISIPLAYNLQELIVFLTCIRIGPRLSSPFGTVSCIIGTNTKFSCALSTSYSTKTQCTGYLIRLSECAVPENIHTSPTEGIEISLGVGDFVRPKNLKKCMKLNWNLQRGGEVLEKIPSTGGGGFEYFLELNNNKLFY